MTGNAIKRSNSRLGISIIAWIIVQYFVAPFFVYKIFSPDNSIYQSFTNIQLVLSYTIIVISIIIHGDNGLDVFQDYFSLGMIVLSCFLLASFGFWDQIIFKIPFVLLGTSLFGYMFNNRHSLKTPSLKSVFFGLSWSIGTVAAMSFVHLLLVSDTGTIPPNSLVMQYIANMSMYHFTIFTVVEEAYFRGLVFGFLVMDGFNEDFALLVQGILFWSIHYTKLNNGVLVFILLPVFIFSSALMIKKFKTLYATIIMHTLNNVFGGILVTVFAGWLSHL
jgi:membrane protease YdiL (CAAX protease family)